MTAASLAPAEAELLRLETAVTAIAANLVELDGNQARLDLDRTRLTGRTAAAWADASDALGRLWDGYRMLTELIARARSLRDQRRPSDADRAAFVHEVLGRSVTLSTRTVPLAQRGLLGTGQVSTTCSPAELLAAMEAAFATAAGVADQAGRVWQRLLPAAAEAAAALDTVRGLVGASDRRPGGGSATLDEADRRLGAFTAALATDPLGVAEAELDAVRALIARADAERTSATELREALAQRLTDAHALAEELAGQRRTAEAAAAAAAGRFADADLAPVPGTDLGADLAAIDALAAAGQWALISPRLAAWTRRARDLLAGLRDSAARNTGLLADRNELRGRIDAYRAKAVRRGLAESGELTTLAEAARAALHTAPCDLDSARAAVAAYQDALTATIARLNP